MARLETEARSFHAMHPLDHHLTNIDEFWMNYFSRKQLVKAEGGIYDQDFCISVHTVSVSRVYAV